MNGVLESLETSWNRLYFKRPTKQTFTEIVSIVCRT